VDDAGERVLIAGAHDAANGQVSTWGESRHPPRHYRNADRRRRTGSYRLVPFPHERKAIDIGSFYVDDSKIATSWVEADRRLAMLGAIGVVLPGIPQSVLGALYRPSSADMIKGLFRVGAMIACSCSSHDRARAETAAIEGAVETKPAPASPVRG